MGEAHVCGVYIFDGHDDELIALVADEADVPRWVTAVEGMIEEKRKRYREGDHPWDYAGVCRVDRIPVQYGPPVDPFPPLSPETVGPDDTPHSMPSERPPVGYKLVGGPLDGYTSENDPDRPIAGED